MVSGTEAEQTGLLTQQDSQPAAATEAPSQADTSRDGTPASGSEQAADTLPAADQHTAQQDATEGPPSGPKQACRQRRERQVQTKQRWQLKRKLADISADVELLNHEVRVARFPALCPALR